MGGRQQRRLGVVGHGPRLVLDELCHTAHSMAPAMAALAVEVPQIQFIARGCASSFVYEAVEELHIFPSRSWTPSIFLRAPCVWQCVSPQLLLGELRTFPAVHREI